MVPPKLIGARETKAKGPGFDPSCADIFSFLSGLRWWDGTRHVRILHFMRNTEYLQVNKFMAHWSARLLRHPKGLGFSSSCSSFPYISGQ